VVNGAIYLIGSYDFFVNRPSCYVNQQQLQEQCPRVATTYHRSVLFCIGAPNQTWVQLLFCSLSNAGARNLWLASQMWLFWWQHLACLIFS